MRWVLTSDQEDTRIDDAGGQTKIVDTSYYPYVNLTDQEWRMVRAAPEMLAMLKAIEDHEYGYGIGPTHQELLALIADAEGRDG